MVSQLDPDQLTEALNVQRKLDEVARALAAYPSIGAQSAGAFRAAVELGRHGDKRLRCRR